MADKTINTRIVLRHDTAANWTTNNPVLKLGEMGLETDSSKMKIGDGTKTWSELSYAGMSSSDVQALIDAAKDDFTELVPESSVTDAEALATITSKKKGDMAVVKRSIGDSHYSYTAYFYNGSAWAAMDGNYSAENVYFNADLTYTKAFGELPAVPSTGSATLSAKDKTVKEVLATILAKRAQPSKTEPAVSLSGTQGSSDLEIGTTVSVSNKTMTSSLSAGSYTYGPATGITASTWSTEVKYTAGKSGSITTGTSASTPYSYSFQMGTDGETIKVQFSAEATHGAGTVAVDNLGDASNPTVQIAAGTKSNSSTASYTCYRKMFYGTRENVDALDSDKIRALTGVKAATKASNSLTVNVPVNAKRVMIACPSGYSVTSVKDVNDSSSEIFSAFKTMTVSVEGAEGYTAVDYTVWYTDYANPATTANTYKVTIA